MAKILLNDMNTDIIPVMDFGCQYGGLAWAADNVFSYSDFVDETELNEEGMDPEDYNYAVRLIREEYDGRIEFDEAVLRMAPECIDGAFDAYDIKAKLVPGSCKWDHPSQYNYRDDRIDFDMLVDAGWVEDTILELIEDDPEFINFVSEYFHNMYTAEAIDKLHSYLNPRSSDYWRAVSCLVSYIVSQDEVIREDATKDLEEDLTTNGYYVSYSSLGMYR